MLDGPSGLSFKRKGNNHTNDFKDAVDILIFIIIIHMI